MKIVACSDVHLTDPENELSNRFFGFLSNVVPQFERFYILGDLFDVWPITRKKALNRFAKFFTQFKNLIHQGTQITYIEGNHDFHLGEEIQEIGIKVVPKELTENWQGQKVFMTHGDLYSSSAVYPFSRKILRSRVTKKILQSLPEDWVYGLGNWASTNSRKFSHAKGNRIDIVRENYRKNVHKFAENKKYDLILMGHTHIPDDVFFSNSNTRYFNLGDWVENCTYLEFINGKSTIKKYEPIF